MLYLIVGIEFVAIVVLLLRRHEIMAWFFDEPPANYKQSNFADHTHHGIHAGVTSGTPPPKPKAMTAPISRNNHWHAEYLTAIKTNQLLSDDNRELKKERDKLQRRVKKLASTKPRK